MKLPIHYNVSIQDWPEGQAVPTKFAVGKTGKCNHQCGRGDLFPKRSSKPFHCDAL